MTHSLLCKKMNTYSGGPQSFSPSYASENPRFSAMPVLITVLTGLKLLPQFGARSPSPQMEAEWCGHFYTSGNRELFSILKMPLELSTRVASVESPSLRS